MHFLVGEDAEWVDDAFRELGEVLHPSGDEDNALRDDYLPREGYIHLVMGLLESSNAAVRRWAVKTMAMQLIRDHGDICDGTLMLCIDALASRLQDDDQRCLALQALHSLGEGGRLNMLSEHTGAVVARLEDSDDKVVEWAVKVLGCEMMAALGELKLGELEQANLSQHAGVVVAKLEDSDWQVRRAAMQTLGKMEPATIAQHADAVVAMLEDSDGFVRHQAVETFGRLEPATRAQYADAVIKKLHCNDKHVREAALEALAKLEAATLAQHAFAVVARLEDSE